MKKVGLLLLILLTLFQSCEEKKEEPKTNTCSSDDFIDEITSQNFKMGFSTWPYGPNQSDVDDTYEFIFNNADIYSEHLDNKIPWDAWINETALPQEFVGDVNARAARRPTNMDLLLAVSLLNGDRSDLIEDYDGSTPSYTQMNDQAIEDAYFQHLVYLVEQLQPDYLLMAIEVNELKIHNDSKWQEYLLLMDNIFSRIKNEYPDMQLSTSVTLHNWYEPDISDQETLISEISDYINQFDFTAISFYPFFKGMHSQEDFQAAFDFLHSQTEQPIAFVETTHLAEDLSVEGLDLFIESDPCEQLTYLETLAKNAQKNDYEFIIWWAYRDYDELWETFPEEVKDIGKLWRDTGLLDENGNQRPAFESWQRLFNK